MKIMYAQGVEMLWQDASWGLPKQRDFIHTRKQSVVFSCNVNKMNQNSFNSDLALIYSAKYQQSAMTVPSELEVQWVIALTIFFNTYTIVRLFYRNLETKTMEIIMLREHWLVSTSSLPASEVSEKFLTFSSVVSPRATLILCGWTSI